MSFGQEKIPFVDYSEVAQLAGESSRNGNAAKTIAYVNTINKNDSSYYRAMVSKTFYQLNLERYDQAIALADRGLEQECGDLKRSFYVNKAVALIHQKKYAEAIKAIDEGIKFYPRNVVLWFNKGAAQVYLGKTQDAVASYQKAITLNPFYRNTYLQLGNIYYKQERISQALMCFDLYLLMEPDADNALTILNSLNTIVSGKNENSRDPGLTLSPDDAAFEEIDLILTNSIALNKNYTTGNEIDIALIRQNHALLQQLENFSGNGGFWDTKFVPFYKWIRAKGYFDLFSYTVSFSIENEKYKKVVERKAHEIASFIDIYKAKWAEIAGKNTLHRNGKKEEVQFNYENGHVRSIGKLVNESTVGYWEFYNDEGRLTIQGSFDDKGNKTGKWEWFNQYGALHESANYSNNRLNGGYTLYYDNGNKAAVASYRDDQLEGTYSYYNDKGALIHVEQYKGGQLDGPYTSFFDVGKVLPEYEIPYESDQVKGKVTQYYPNGALCSEISFREGRRNGPEIKYHLNGTISSEITNVDGQLNGSYRTFYKNGNPFEVGQGEEGLFEGAWKSYYDDGTLQASYSYLAGDLDGPYTYYDTDGKSYYEYEYKKGELTAYKFFDKNGKILKQDRKKGGEFYFKGFSTQGNITAEGLYDVKGGKKGHWKFYSDNGVLNEEGEFRDNRIQGDYKTYYNNGGIQSITPYENDTLSGYYVDYHKNGKIKSQGWYKNNNLHGEWRSYEVDGTLSAVNFYHKGLLQGEQRYFSPGGKLSGISSYQFGELVSDTFFDREGKLFETIEYRNQEPAYEVLAQHFNKKPRSRISYLNGVRHGPVTEFDYYGRKVASGEYLNGELHGDWTWYDDKGKIESTAHYVNGHLNGDYLSYHENGQPDLAFYYEYGSMEKTWVTYYKDGTMNTRGEYKDNQLHGRKEFYSPSGKPQLVRFYDRGRLIGYSYPDKNSKELSMIPLANETGKVKAFYDNGRLSREMEYKNGDIVNDYKEFYYTGELSTEIHFEQGDYNGLHIEYFKNGQVKTKSEYLFGNLHGTVKEYYANGILKKEEHYLNNVKEGLSRTFDENGNPVTEEDFFNGNIASTKTY